MHPDWNGRRPAGSAHFAYVDNQEGTYSARRRSRLRRRCCARALSRGGTTTPWAAIWRRTFRRVMMIAPAPMPIRTNWTLRAIRNGSRPYSSPLGEAAGVEDVKHYADEVNGHQRRNEPADVDDSGGGSDPVGRVEGPGKVEADHGARPADGQNDHQPGEHPERRAARHQQHRGPGRRGGGGNQEHHGGAPQRMPGDEPANQRSGRDGGGNVYGHQSGDGAGIEALRGNQERVAPGHGKHRAAELDGEVAPQPQPRARLPPGTGKGDAGGLQPLAWFRARVSGRLVLQQRPVPGRRRARTSPRASGTRGSIRRSGGSSRTGPR